MESIYRDLYAQWALAAEAVDDITPDMDLEDQEHLRNLEMDARAAFDDYAYYMQAILD